MFKTVQTRPRYLHSGYEIPSRFAGFSLEDSDELMKIEDLLLERLDAHSEVDGHDFSTREANIFVYTDDPRPTFEVLRSILSEHRLWVHAPIAYLQVDGNQYSILWPKGANHDGAHCVWPTQSSGAGRLSQRVQRLCAKLDPS
jgi:hypothetical protein